MKYVLGIDPDSSKHGLAIYENGELIVCTTATTVEIVTNHLPKLQNNNVLVSMENVQANAFVYTRNNKGGRAVIAKIGMGIGKCQQAQAELMQWLEFLRVKTVLHKPQAGNWAKNKQQFERLTGWTGRSNEDSRSAAFFGFIALKIITK